ncbi:MAG TPA: ABC transporter permease [Puia sp.]|nr:ABC transporter permease [Puia sp.]
MFKNYFKTAYRNLIRNKSYTFINIAGLAIGIAICMIIFIVIQFELSFDKFHTKKDRIYRVLTEYKHSDSKDVFYASAVPFALPKGMKTAFPQIEKITAIYTDGNDQIQVLDNDGHPTKKFKEQKGVFFAEPSFFDIFDFPWLAGNPKTALNDPNTAVLTKEIAEKYFGDWKTAMGKTIKWRNAYTLKITGILASIPANTDFQLKIVIAYGTGFTAEIARSSDWESTNSSFGCYILLPPNLSVETFNKQLRAFSKKMEPADDKDSHIIQSLNFVHDDSQKIGNYSGKTFSPQLIRALWLIAGFILLIACVNFINLSTAQAVNRSKEVGVRKVLGSNKTQLKIQFIVETFLIVVLAVALSILISVLVLPVINNILEVSLNFNLIQNPSILLFLFIITIVVTLLAGFYPSIVLSGFNPINALKSKLASKSTKGISLRRGLVVFQFIIAQALIIGTLIIIKQMNYFSNQPIGFDKNNIVNVPFPNDSTSVTKLDFLRKELSAVKGIQQISFSSTTPVEDDNDNWTTFNFDNAAKETDFFAIIKWVDNQYLPTYKLPLIAGRNLEASDTAREFLVDELLLKNLGIRKPEDALNKRISLWDGRIKGIIVGVLKEFNSRSFRRDLAPVLMTTRKSGYNNAGLKLTSADVPATMKTVEKMWEQIFPEFVFEYKFLDSKIDSFYKQERQLSQLYKIFAVIAILLSCLGLYGLASFMAVQRIKEVGIRKVLGATPSNIVYLFSKEFVILIAVAFAIATPIAWYYMHQWLQDYPFRINLSWWIFLAGGIASVIIALTTVSFQAIKAAMANPVKSLRSE